MIERNYSNDHLFPDEVERRRNGKHRNSRFYLDGVDSFACRSFAPRRIANWCTQLFEERMDFRHGLLK